MGNALTPEQIANLLKVHEKENAPKRERYPIPVQKGPIKLHDLYSPCVSRRCGSPTIYTYRGVRYCVPHLINRVNDDFERIESEEAASSV